MKRNKKIAMLIATTIIASSTVTMNVSAMEFKSANEKLNTSQQIQLQKETKELTQKSKLLEEKVNKQKNIGFKDFKESNSNTIEPQTFTLTSTGGEGGEGGFGTYPTRNGVILVTTDSTTAGIQHGHAGIIWTSTTTVESFPGGGVGRYSNTWGNTYLTVYGATAIGTTADQDNEASNWCDAQRGKSYNWIFTNTGTRSSFYCSQLVWAAFKDKYGINLDDDGGIVWPIDIVNSYKTSLVYKK